MKYDIGLEEALSRTLERLTPLPPIDIEIDKAAGLIVAEDCIAIIIGSGSAPYEIIQHLVKKLFVILIPHWTKNR